MQIRKNIWTCLLLLVIVTGLSSSGYFIYQGYVAQQALEENIEYQVVMAIEAQHPEVYVIAVQTIEDRVVVYFIPPDGELTDEYVDNVLIDIVTVLYNIYPEAIGYELLPSHIEEIDTFDGTVHYGVAHNRLAFLNIAAQMIAVSDNPVDDLNMLWAEGMWGNLDPRTVSPVSTPTAREPGHIPPWASPSETSIREWIGAASD